MEYTIISAKSLDDLVVAVANARDDWRPIGGPFVIPPKDRQEVTGVDGNKFKPVYAQALIKGIQHGA